MSKNKYVIRETSVRPENGNLPLYLHGFHRGRDVSLVFGNKNAHEYDSQESVGRMLVRVKEISGRSTWAIELKEKTTPCYWCERKKSEHIPLEGKLYCPVARMKTVYEPS